jgi:hypothetical protein
MTSTTTELQVLDAGNAELALPNLAKQINAAVTDAENHARSAMDVALTAGALLTQAKQQVPHGEWENWLASNCRVAPRTAQSYMRLFKQVPLLEDSKAQRVADLPLREAMRAIATNPEKPPTQKGGFVFAKKDEAERAAAVLRSGASALRAVSKKIEWSRSMKGHEVAALKKKLALVLESLDKLEGADHE